MRETAGGPVLETHQVRANDECSWHNVSEKLKFAEERYITVKTKFLDPACTRDAYYDNIRIWIMDIPEVLQQNHYYPFGMNMTGIEEDDQQTLSSLEENMYQYNGKEKDLSLGLHWHDYGARQYDAQLGRWNGVDPLAEKYFSYSSYNYVMNNPIMFVDPDGREVSGATKDDAKKLHEDLNTIFADEKFDKFRSLITRSGKKGKGKKFNKIDSDALKGALEGLEGDDLALAKITANTINSDDKHKVEFADAKENVSYSTSSAFIDVVIDEVKEKAQTQFEEQDGRIGSHFIFANNFPGATVKTKSGSASLIYDGDNMSSQNRAIVTGHELFGHGMSLQDPDHQNGASQHVQAVQTENLIRRVMGLHDTQIDGSKHGNKGNKGALINAKELPSYK